MTTKSTKIPIEDFDTQARQHVLAILGDGLWRSVTELRQHIPAELVEARLKHLLNIGIVENPQEYGRMLLVDAVVEFLKVDKRLQCRTVGAEIEVRLESKELGTGMEPPDGKDDRAHAPDEVSVAAPEIQAARLDSHPR